jgi:hypothetical protein
MTYTPDKATGISEGGKVTLPAYSPKGRCETSEPKPAKTEGDTMMINTKLWMTWFSVVSVILVLAGAFFAFIGLGVLPVNKDLLLQWESAIYGAIMVGWGATLLFAGRLAFRR